MSYYMTLYSPSARCASLDAIEGPLFSDFDADYAVEEGSDDDWRRLTLTFEGEEEPFATIYRATTDTPEGSDPLEAALEDIEDGEPASAVAWLREYLPRAKTAYTFAIDSHGVEAARAVLHGIWCELGGVKQADFEGFTNDEDFHILWQFIDEASGASRSASERAVPARMLETIDRPRGPTLWQMAVLSDGRWRKFEMDLGNAEQVAAFRAGRVPDGVTPR